MPLKIRARGKLKQYGIWMPRAIFHPGNARLEHFVPTNWEESICGFANVADLSESDANDTRKCRVCIWRLITKEYIELDL